MKKLIAVFVMVSLLILSCGKKQKTATKLKKGTPAYELASQVSNKLPEYNPDQNKVLATTNYFKYTTADVFQKFQDLAGKQTNMLTRLDTARLQMQMTQLVKNLVETKLLSTLADQQGVTVEPAEVDSLLEMQYQRAGGEEQFKKRLTQQEVTLDAIRQSIKTSLKIQAYIDEQVKKDIAPSEEDIVNYYNENYKDVETVSARHILVQPQKGQEDQAKSKIDEIKTQLDNGADFATLAKEHSQGPSSKKGGDLGSFTHGDMVPPFEQAAFALEPGEISDPVKTRFGYHLIKVYDKNTESKPLEEVKNQIVQQLETKNRQSATREFIDKKKEEANLELKI